jgi:Protein of unknown function (DUF3455)
MPLVNAKSIDDAFSPRKKWAAPLIHVTRRAPFIACVATLTAVTAALPQLARAALVTPPPVPANIQVPQGNKAFLVGHAIGTQNYVCLPSGDGFKFTLFTPQATLFSNDHEELTTHFFSPNPSENPPPPGQISNGTVRATWRHSQDSSIVWAKLASGESSVDPNFVRQGAIPWLLLRVSGAKRGPPGGAVLTQTTFVQRLNTFGGVAPSSGCAKASDVGNQAFVPYTADYFFYRVD